MIKKNLESDKLIIGTDRTLKELKAGNIKSVFLSANCPVEVKEDITRYCEIGSVALESLLESNEELGTICRKAFLISVLSFKND